MARAGLEPAAVFGSPVGLPPISLQFSTLWGHRASIFSGCPQKFPPLSLGCPRIALDVAERQKPCVPTDFQGILGDFPTPLDVAGGPWMVGRLGLEPRTKALKEHS